MNYGNSQSQSQSQPQAQSITPAQGFELVRKYGTSPLFLSAVIVYSFMILLQLTYLFMPRWSSIESYLNFLFNNMGINDVGGVSDYFNSFNSFTDFVKIFYNIGMVFGVIALIGPILICAGLWIQYSASRDTSSAQIKTTGLSIIKVITVINFVITAALMVLMSLIILIAGIVAAVAAAGEEAAAAVALIIVFGIFFLIVAGVTVFIVVYYLKIISIIKSFTAAASIGKIDDKISVFVPVVNIIIAVYQLFGIFYMIIILPLYSLVLKNMMTQFGEYPDFSYFYQNFSNLLSARDIILSSLVSLLNAAFLVIISVLILSYRKKITAMLYYNNSNGSGGSNTPRYVGRDYGQIQNPLNPPSLNPAPNEQKEERRQQPFVPPQ